MKRGKFITFEGIDGCGKSTQVRKLAQYILELSKYNHVLITREPFRDTKIRDILKQEEDPYSQAKKLAQLFVEDRKLHVKTIIDENLKRGLFIISDRYSFSTLAYQQAQGIPIEELIKMHKGLPIPDITFIIDVPVKTAMQRMKKDSIRKAEHKFEKNMDFIRKLRTNYFKLAKLPKHRVVMIDGRKNIEEIFEKQIKPAFDKFLSNNST